MDVSYFLMKINHGENSFSVLLPPWRRYVMDLVDEQ